MNKNIIKYTNKPIPKPTKQPHRSLEVNVRISDTDLFKTMITIIEDFIKDERINKEIRNEYKVKGLNIIEDQELLKRAKERMRNDNSVRYTLDNLRSRNKERKLK
ncbi:hypothetical protein PN398_07925 [Romboutsia sp. 1001216sp1]|uniref:hypothetical protein n=1 Tax=unclassified Romboutsia TaxID=2626894 RepID=UPI00189DAE6F|nr:MULTISPECIES: hypothetical protein [unclassified Romboutsia]MDB8790646.1 hypothetical protein [Romboutsia sp. 1001216sp1]MDB8803265.1 hypothetical protein [Romboutsia sp. 1001216sp1]MDB8814627.1 hypothetical protein [Romboutsia sp. 1001216sp1]